MQQSQNIGSRKRRRTSKRSRTEQIQEPSSNQTFISFSTNNISSSSSSSSSTSSGNTNSSNPITSTDTIDSNISGILPTGNTSSSKPKRKRQKVLSEQAKIEEDIPITSSIEISYPSTSREQSTECTNANQTFQRVQQLKLLKGSIYNRRRNSPVSSTVSSERQPSISSSSTRREGEQEEMSEQRNTIAFEHLLQSLGGYGLLTTRPRISDDEIDVLIENLKQEAGEGKNYDAVSELCNFLSISTEHSLNTSKINELVPHLARLLQNNHNYELALLSARALTHMIDAMPAATSIFIREGIIPIMNEKLLNIEFIDLAEQCIQCLYIMSNDPQSSSTANYLLKEGVLMSSLAFIDFFSMDLQRKIAMMASNLCRRIPPALFGNIEASLPNLANFLQSSDAKIVESGAKCFHKIALSFASNSSKLDIICNSTVIDYSLSIISNANNATNKIALSSILGFLTCASRGSFSLCKELHEKGIATILSSLLVNEKEDEITDSETSMRAVKENLPEILQLLLELLPSPQNLNERFVTDTPLGVRKMLLQLMVTSEEYLQQDKSLSFQIMTSEVDKEVNSKKKKLFEDNPNLLINFGECMIPLLMDMFSATHAEYVANKCLTIIGTILHFSTADILKQMLLNIPISTFISSMMASHRLAQVATAIQFADILMNKLPDIFSSYLVREGVLYKVRKLSGRDVHDKKVKLMIDLMKEKVKREYKKAEKMKNEQVEKTTQTPENNPRESDSDKEGNNKRIASYMLPRVKAPEPPVTSSLNPQKCDYSAMTGLELTSYVVAIAQLFQQKYFSDVNKFDSPLVSKLKDLADELRDFVNQPFDSEEQTQTLKKIRQLFIEGISNFEIFNSSIISSINTYLTQLSLESEQPALDRLQRIQTFFKVFDQKIDDQKAFLLSSSPFRSVRSSSFSKSPSFSPKKGIVKPAASESNQHSYLLELIWKLQACLSSVENFGLIVNENQSLLHNIGHTINVLSRPLRIRLSERGAQSSSSGNNDEAIEVLVSPSAEVNAIVKYLQTRQSKKEELDDRKRELLRRIKDKEENEEEENEEAYQHLHNQERVDVMGGSIGYFAVEEEEDDHYGTSTNTVHISCSNENKPSSSKQAIIEKYEFLSNTNSKKEEDIKEKKIAVEANNAQYNLYMNGEIIDSNMTIFQVLYRQSHKAGKSLQHPSSMRFWDSIHSIEYEKKSPNAQEALITSDNEWQLAASSKKKRGKRSIQKKVVGSQPSLGSNLVTYPSPTDYLDGEEKSVQHELRLYHCIQKLNAMLDNVTSLINIGADEDAIACLSLLRLIHMICQETNILDHFEEALAERKRVIISSREFINTKISSKLVRQLQDPYILFTNCLPEWVMHLVSEYSFLFSYDTRKFYFQLHFGIARAIKKIQERQTRNDMNNRRNNGFVRIEKQKIKLARGTKFLESAFKVMENYGTTKAILEFEYENEEGTGLGPTLEFYTLVSEEIQKAGLNIWRDENNESGDGEQHECLPHDRIVKSCSGLFPKPIDPNNESVVQREERIFNFLGRFVARAIYDDRIIDLPFSNSFYKAVQGHQLEYLDIKDIDPALFKQLEAMRTLIHEKHKIEASSMSADMKKKKINALTLNNDGVTTIDLLYQVFVLPGYPDIELKPNGKNIDLTIWNLEEYIELVSQYMLRIGVERQFQAFRNGFDAVLSNRNMLNYFSYSELDDMICGCEEQWTVQYLIENTRCDHGYTQSSKAVQYLFTVMSEMTSTEQRLFLKFVTGSSKLPSGGLKALNPKMTIVLKPVPSDSNVNADMFLPSVMTCANFIKLPNYSSQQILKIQLFKAMELGQDSFLLS
jgi:E3 ubiquitin-protein ligase TRIP12